MNAKWGHKTIRLRTHPVVKAWDVDIGRWSLRIVQLTKKKFQCSVYLGLMYVGRTYGSTLQASITNAHKRCLENFKNYAELLNYEVEE